MAETRISEITKLKGKKASVVLEDNPFHVEGGGQPGDTGHLEAEGFLAEVTDCRKDDGRAVVDLKVRKGTLETGMAVTATVDMERNLLLTRMHTGQHVLSRVLKNMGDINTYKVDIGTKMSTVYMRYDGELNWDLLFEAEEETNRVIDEDIPVEVLHRPVEEARKMEGLKARWDRLTDETIQIVHIRNFDLNACSGTHTPSTGPIGHIAIDGFKGTAPEWEVRYTVHGDAYVAKQSRLFRRLLSEINCRPNEIGKVYRRLQDDRDAANHALSNARKFLSFPWKEDDAAGTPFRSLELWGMPRDLVTPSAVAIGREHPDSVALALLNEDGTGKIPFILVSGKDVNLDLRAFLKGHPELEVRGGGANGLVSGVTGCRSMTRWKAALEADLKK